MNKEQVVEERAFAWLVEHEKISASIIIGSFLGALGLVLEFIQ